MILEKEIIGACLTYEKCFAQAVDRLQKKHFQYFAPVFEQIQMFFKEGKDHEDIVFTVKERLGDKITDNHFFDFVNSSVPTITDRIEQLLDIYNRKRLKEISDSIYNIEPDEPYRDKTIKAIHELSHLLSGESKTQQTMAEVMSDTIELLDKIRQGQSLEMRCELNIDKITGGFQRGQFYILAARPSMGKTALSVQIAHEISRECPVGFLSLETTNKSLGMRSLSNFSEFSGDKMRGGYISDDEFDKLKNDAKFLSEMRITMDESTDVSAEGIRAKVNTMKRKDDIGLLIIDYVQLMKSDKDNREQQIAEISRSCVSVAKEFNICVIGLAQLNRECEKRSDKRPMLSDLRESGQLEQDAFCVMFLNRPEHYGIKQYPDGESTKDIAEIIIAKHKDGKTGLKKQLFHKEIMKFRNINPF